MTVKVAKAKRRSPRGNWLVVEMHQGKIVWCTWVRTWGGVQASKRHKEKFLAEYQKTENLRAARSHNATEPKMVGRVFILDIERMLAFSITEGADEINDLHRLWEKS